MKKSSYSTQLIVDIILSILICLCFYFTYFLFFVKCFFAFCVPALSNTKGTSKGAFSKMVPLKRKCALLSASFAYAQDLGRFFKAPRQSPPPRRFCSAMSIPDFPDCFAISPRKSASCDTIKKGTLKSVPFLMVPLKRIGLSTPPLPRVCSTTELQRRFGIAHHTQLF